MTCVGVGCEHVHEAVVGVEDAEAGDEEGLLQDVAPPEPRHSLVPDTAQHLSTPAVIFCLTSSIKTREADQWLESAV